MNVYNDITLVIVCYKSYELIKSNLDALKRFKTIIVDNSNCNKTYNLVKDLNNIQFIKTINNLGYGKANNLAIANAKTEFVLILNPDIIVNPVEIESLYSKVTDYNNVGILAPSLYSQNNERRTNGSRSYLKKKLFKNVKNSKDFAVGDTCYDYVIGCSMLIKRDFFNEIGGFDNDFFMYFEDNEICDRVYKFKKVVIETPISKMIHMEGESSDKSFIIDCKLSIIHKISEFIYLNKNLSKLNTYKNLVIQLFDFSQRMLFNFLTFKFKKSFKNFLRILSIVLYVTSLYKLI
jgi:GT2 family glycosyltransferase